MTQREAKEHRTVSRVTTILERVAVQREGLRLGELVELLSAPKSSVFGLVKGLVATGYLREENGRYVIGPAVSALLAPARPSIIDFVQPVMDSLQQHFNETVSLCARVGTSIVYVDSTPSSHVIRYATPFRERRPLYPTSAGKCFLAYGSKSLRQSYLESRFAGEQLERIKDELVQVEKTGLALNRGETLQDVSAVAAPIFLNGQLTHCLAVAGPSSRIGDQLDAIGDFLKKEITALKESAPHP